MSGCGHTPEDHARIIREQVRLSLPPSEVELTEAIVTGVALNVRDGLPAEAST